MDQKALYRNNRPVIWGRKLRATFKHFLVYAKQEPQPALAADLTAFAAEVLEVINHPSVAHLRAESDRWEQEALELAAQRRAQHRVRKVPAPTAEPKKKAV
jgi:hypothetical protein